MKIIRDIRQHYVDEQLAILGKTTFTDNRNYQRVIRAIPKHFGSNDIFACMMLAFAFGEMKGRECERDMIKWNALATFQNMKSYAQVHNGQLPKTQKELKEWIEETKKEVGL